MTCKGVVARVGPAVRVLLLACLAGCASPPSKVDPLEPLNRAMYQVHEVVDGKIVKPVAQAYVDNTPRPIQTGISNFFGNIDDLFTGINNLLQGKPARAGDDFGRFLTNTMFSLGFLDLASMAGITKDKTDFGITFGKWGFPDGPYLFVPVFGPTTVRDGTGVIIRAYAAPTGYIPEVAVRNVVWGVGFLDARAQALQAESVIDTAALDKYRFIRRAYLRNRHYQIYDGKPPADSEDE